MASRNPLKALAAREDLKSEYTEIKMGLGERELRRMKVEERKYQKFFMQYSVNNLAIYVCIYYVRWMFHTLICFSSLQGIINGR